MSASQFEAYSDDKCTDKFTLKYPNDLIASLSESNKKSVYMTSGYSSECQKVELKVNDHRNFFQKWVCPKATTSSVCIDDLAGKKACFENVDSTTTLTGCYLQNTAEYSNAILNGGSVDCKKPILTRNTAYLF